MDFLSANIICKIIWRKVVCFLLWLPNRPDPWGAVLPQIIYVPISLVYDAAPARLGGGSP